MEEVFQNINTNRTVDGDVPKSVEYGEKQAAVSVMEGDDTGHDRNNFKVEEDEEAEDLLSQAAHSVGAAFANVLENLHFDVETISSQMEDMTAATTPCTASDDPSYRIHEVDAELHQAAMKEAQEWKDKYETINSQHDAAQLKIANLYLQVQAPY